jgi:aspartyl-tRNA(Asn)/glutamyl-tRNA(Gln) amidotransferase subunit C
MKLSKKEVEYIATLARLELSDQEKEKYAEQLSAILDYVEQLNKLSTDKVEPIGHITGVENVMHKDEIKNKLDRENMLMNAPDKENGFIKVKSIFDN